MSNLNELIVDVTATVVSPTEFQAEADIEISNQFSVTASADLAVKIEAGDDIQIPTVTNIKVDEYGLLTFDEPDFSKLEKFNPIISYLITVNGTQIESTTNSVSILSMLVDGDNIIDIKTKALLTTYSENVEEIVEFSTPEYTPASLFDYQSKTIDGIEGWEIIKYKGTSDNINIPEYNDDGLPILSIQGSAFANNKTTGLFIRNIQGVSSIYSHHIINFPGLTMNYMTGLFSNWYNLRIVEALNTSNVIAMYSTFRGCRELISIPELDTNNLRSMNKTFENCVKLEKIPSFNLSNCTQQGSLSNMVSGCTSLKEFLPYGMKVSFDLSSSTLFERENLVTVLNNLATVTTTQTLTLGETNLAKLTDEDKKIATDKGWTLA